MNSYRLLACGVVLGLAIAGCGTENADKNVMGQETAPAEQSVLAPGNSAEFHSLAATANIDNSFASADCANTGAGSSTCAPVPQASANIAEPMTTVETRLADPIPSDTEQNILTEPVSPEDEAIIRDALFTLGEERCVPDSASGVECPADEPQPNGQVQF